MNKKIKITKCKKAIVSFYKCPECKKIVFFGEREIIGELKKWKRKVEKENR